MGMRAGGEDIGAEIDGGIFVETGIFQRSLMDR